LKCVDVDVDVDVDVFLTDSHQVAAPSRACDRLIDFLAHIRELVLFCGLPAESLDALLPKAIEEIFAQLAEEERFWENVVIGMYPHISLFHIHI
jgi:hypothetical protein